MPLCWFFFKWISAFSCSHPLLFYAEVIVESALYKCVLKPLKDAIDSYLREIHTKDGVFQLLKENQLVIQSTTTTDLGITTSVPETAVLEKIIHKFTTMHKAYSPEKKIAILLKSCKLIYDSMAQGNPGRIILLKHLFSLPPPQLLLCLFPSCNEKGTKVLIWNWSLVCLA